MVTEADILTTLDDSNKQGYYSSFIELGHVYSYLIDCRLNVFRSNDGKWVIAAERLGFNPRAGGIVLDISYFGNCLLNLEEYNGQNTNYYSLYPVDQNSFNEAFDGEVLKPDANHLMVRGVKFGLHHNKQDYFDAGIELKEYEPNEITVEEAGRFLITKYREIFRATDEELYKSIPSDLEKVLVLDEWYHKDYVEIIHPQISDEQLRYTYDFNKNLSGGEGYMDYDSFAAIFRQAEEKNDTHNQQQWQDNRPSSCETWQQIAKVIVTGDTAQYKPTLEPNTHWKNWSDSGSM